MRFTTDDITREKGVATSKSHFAGNYTPSDGMLLTLADEVG